MARERKHKAIRHKVVSVQYDNYLAQTARNLCDQLVSAASHGSAAAALVVEKAALKNHPQDFAVDTDSDLAQAVRDLHVVVKSAALQGNPDAALVMGKTPLETLGNIVNRLTAPHASETP
jgi:hypothetical protein